MTFDDIFFLFLWIIKEFLNFDDFMTIFSIFSQFLFDTLSPLKIFVLQFKADSFAH